MSRWSPSVVAQAPRDMRRGGGVGMAAALMGGMAQYDDLQALREQRRQQAEAERVRNAQLEMQQRGEQRTIDEIAYERGQAQITAENQFAAAGAEPLDAPESGDPVRTAEAGQQESEARRIEREATDLYPVKYQQFKLPNGEMRRLDGNAKARQAAITAGMAAIAQRQQGEAKLTADLTLEQERQKGRMELQQARNGARKAAAGRGGSGPAAASDEAGITPTQARSAAQKAQSDIGGMMARRPVRSSGELRSQYDQRLAPWKTDSALTVEQYDPTNNPAARMGFRQAGGMPSSLQKFYPGERPQEVSQDSDEYREIQRGFNELAALRKRGTMSQEEYDMKSRQLGAFWNKTAPSLRTTPGAR